MQNISFEGVTHQFPDDFTNDDISKALKTYKAPPAPVYDPSSYQPQGIGEKIYQALLPRTFKNDAAGNYDATSNEPQPIATPKQLAAAASDVLSVPGRAIASTPDVITGEKPLNESMADTKGSNLAGKILRSPATGAMALTGGLGLIPAAVAGAAANETERIGEGTNGAKDLYKVPLDVGANIVGGKVIGGIANATGNKLVQLASKYLTNKAWNIVKGAIPNVMKNVGDNQYLFDKYNITGNSAEEISSKIGDIVENKTAIRNAKASEIKAEPNNPSVVEKSLKPDDADLNSLSRIKDNIDENASIINDKIKNPGGIDQIMNTIYKLSVVGNVGKNVAKKAIGGLANKAGNLGDVSALSELSPAVQSDFTELRKLIPLEKSSGLVTNTITKASEANRLNSILRNNPRLGGNDQWMAKYNQVNEESDALVQKIKDVTNNRLSEEALAHLLFLPITNQVSGAFDQSPDTTSDEKK